MTTHMLALTCLLSLTAPAWSAPCEAILGAHGFKAEAQVTCRFGQRENQGLDWARDCARHQDPRLNMTEIRRGTETFQATARRMGSAAACEDVLRRFDGVLYQLE